jgi:AcrR family transcriptional regulator
VHDKQKTTGWSDKLEHAEGARARKRREIMDRLSQAAIQLFIDRGVEQTTIDDITESAGIARRTFFNYFESKEDVLLAHQGSGFSAALKPAILAHSAQEKPLVVARQVLLDLASKYETSESIAIDKLLTSTDALRRRKEAAFIELETLVFDAFVEMWPAPDRRGGLRIIAMVVIGTLRIALENWRKAAGASSLRRCIKQGFQSMEAEISW